MITIDEYFLIPPNWESEVSYKRKWETTIQTNLEEGEKRSAVFSWPRRSLRFDISTMSIAETNYFNRKMFRYLHKVWGIPFWGEEQILTSEAASGQAVLNIASTLKSNFAVGATVAIITDYNTFEAGEILSMTSTSITLTANLAATWTQGQYVYPILKGKLTANQSASKPTDAHLSFQFDVKEVPDPDITHVPYTTSSFPTYQSLPLFNLKHNWISELGLEFTHNYDILESIGMLYMDSDAPETNISISANYLFGTKDELYEYLAFFDDREGRWDSFWVSTDAPDIQLTSAQAWNDTTLQINDIEWTDHWSSAWTENMGQYIEFSFPNGYKVQRKILSATSSSITLDAATGVTITAAMLRSTKVSFLVLSRFAVDEVEVKKTTDTISEIDTKFTSIYESITYVASEAPTEEYTG